MGENVRILVVDDDPDITLYLCSLLEDHDYEVETAADTESAWAALERFDPHLVTLDVMMPGRSGLDLLVRLRNDARWATIPLVMLTGNDAIVEDGGASYLRSHGVDRGPDAVLNKPLETASFLQTIASLVTARS
jgi:CheY-like chemotaxis protein